MKFSQILFLVLSFFIAAYASAQVDPSRDALLKSGAQTENLESSRYKVRESAPAPRFAPEPTLNPTPTPTWPPKPRRTKPSPTPTPAPEPVVTPVPTPVEVKKEEKPISKQLVDFVKGGSEKEVQKQRNGVDPRDPRQNLLRLTIAPSYHYVDSSSDYWFRDYYGGSPALDVLAEVWMTPLFGIHAGYFTTFGGDITASPTSTKKVATDHRYFDVGLTWRSFSSLSRRSPSMQIGVSYNEYQMQVPLSETERIRLKSAGAKFDLSARVPESSKRAWLVGTSFIPSLNTDEDKTAIKIKSGSLESAQAWSVNFGKEHVLARTEQFFWRFSHRVDKHIYTGTADTNDPITGTTPEGVAVRSSTTIFSLGFSWGD